MLTQEIRWFEEVGCGWPAGWGGDRRGGRGGAFLLHSKAAF